jgi:HMG (high mobility group) box
VPGNTTGSMVRKVTAYFAFSDVHRAAVREELQAAAGPDAKVSVAVVAQALGKKWKALDDAEKDRCGGAAGSVCMACDYDILH